MAVDKKISYEVQGGAKNYLGKQKQVTAPLKWKSSPDSPETELAYITKAEKDLLVKKDLHGSLKGSVNRGPSGIMSLDGFGSFDSDDPSKDTGMSGAATSAAEAGGGSGADRKELESYISRDQMTSTQLPPGVTKQLPSDIQDYRSAFIAAGGGQRVNPGFFDSRNTVSPAELARARAFNPAAFKAVRGGGLSSFFTGGGLLGNIIRGLGQKFGLGKRFNEPTYDMSGINTRVYEGTMDPTVNPTFQNDLDNRFALANTTNQIPVVVDNDMSLVPDRGLDIAPGDGLPAVTMSRADQDMGSPEEVVQTIIEKAESGQPLSNDEQLILDRTISQIRFP
tara:strand:+ start:22 stop:1032 length:1011 start_codon:yes stop_codon:yes gene_type:complete